MISVLYTADNAYLPYLGISLTSLLENNKEVEVRVYAVLLDASRENIDKLRAVEEKYVNCDLRIIDGRNCVDILEKMNISKYRGSHAANIRLMWNQLIDDDVKRVLYLDSDTIVVDSLKPLFETDMNGACAGVVLDSLSLHYKRQIGFDIDEPYFNSGVILFDVDAWNEAGISSKMKTLIENSEIRYINPDQDYLNLLLREHIFVLNLRYNLQPHHLVFDNKVFFLCNPRTGYYDSNTIVDAVQAPAILHAYRYLGDFCWHRGNMHPAIKQFSMYKDLSPWRDIADEKAKGLILFKIEKMIYKYGNKTLFFVLWFVGQRSWHRLVMLKRGKKANRKTH